VTYIVVGLTSPPPSLSLFLMVCKVGWPSCWLHTHFVRRVDSWVISYGYMPHSGFDVRWVELSKQLVEDIGWQNKVWAQSLGGLIDGVEVTGSKINGDGSNSAGVGVVYVFIAIGDGSLDSLKPFVRCWQIWRGERQRCWEVNWVAYRGCCGLWHRVVWYVVTNFCTGLLPQSSLLVW
jgi:hypothetical protein